MYWYTLLMDGDTAYYTEAESEDSATLFCAILIDQWVEKGYKADQRNRWFDMTLAGSKVSIAVINRSEPIENLVIHLED